MATTLPINSTPSSALRAVQAILAAGLVCGTLDGLTALVVYPVGWKALFQFIASGILGPKSFEGGLKTALLGMALHYTVAFGAAIVYYAASRVLPVLLQRALLLGIAYGVCVHLVMTFVVVPLSAIGRRPQTVQGFLTGLVVHMIVVGPSIALTLRRCLR